MAGQDLTPNPDLGPQESDRTSYRKDAIYSGVALTIVMLLTGIAMRHYFPCELTTYPTIRLVLLAIASGAAGGLASYAGLRLMGHRYFLVRRFGGFLVILLAAVVCIMVTGKTGLGIYYGALIGFVLDAFVDSASLSKQTSKVKIASWTMMVLLGVVVVYFALFSGGGFTAGAAAVCS